MIISNGEMQFINRNWEKDELYNINNYTLISQKDPKRTYQYIFTDENFIDAEPINP